MIDIAALRALEAKATPGPWRFLYYDGHQAIVRRDDDTLFYNPGPDPDTDDAELLCAARNALPELLDRLERYEAALRFYADPMNHGVNFDGERFTRDYGERARKALGEG
jgi:hypothetical protein